MFNLTIVCSGLANGRPGYEATTTRLGAQGPRTWSGCNFTYHFPNILLLVRALVPCKKTESDINDTWKVKNNLKNEVEKLFTILNDCFSSIIKPKIPRNLTRNPAAPALGHALVTAASRIRSCVERACARPVRQHGFL